MTAENLNREEMVVEIAKFGIVLIASIAVGFAIGELAPTWLAELTFITSSGLFVATGALFAALVYAMKFDGRVRSVLSRLGFDFSDNESALIGGGSS